MDLFNNELLKSEFYCFLFLLAGLLHGLHEPVIRVLHNS
jgi:hypothetical protein